MRRLIASLCASLLIVGLMAAPAAAAGPKDPFAGAWKGTEGDPPLPFTIAISGGGETRHVAIADFCNACNPSGYMSIGLGTGTVSGDTMVALIRYHDGGWAVGGARWHAPMEFTFVAQADGTLLVNGEPVYRAGSQP